MQGLLNICWRPESVVDMGARWLFSSPGPAPDCYEGDMRLADQIYDYSYDNETNRYLNSYGGRVEVCYEGEYRPICDVGWDSVDAEVACRNFGYGTPSYCEFLLSTVCTVWYRCGCSIHARVFIFIADAEAVSGSEFGSGNSSVLLRDFVCNGTEYRLLDCQSSIDDRCYSGSSVAGVRCVEGECLALCCSLSTASGVRFHLQSLILPALMAVCNWTLVTELLAQPMRVTTLRQEGC